MAISKEQINRVGLCSYPEDSAASLRPQVEQNTAAIAALDERLEALQPAAGDIAQYSDMAADYTITQPGTYILGYGLGGAQGRVLVNTQALPPGARVRICTGNDTGFELPVYFINNAGQLCPPGIILGVTDSNMTHTSITINASGFIDMLKAPWAECMFEVDSRGITVPAAIIGPDDPGPPPSPAPGSGSGSGPADEIDNTLHLPPTVPLDPLPE